ncbi:NADH dehydrogenase [ubiquinone] 1 alpha subcomplex assembly factor 3-like isoform X1 [Homarus americanus]|uniref:NADH dehydrogenase [ubiquinone] 1 alpha subcomplex assembly factor 3-like n=2 Tax=Homarus americanus TaxID=6706 RepID=A0A8J5MZE1_HOMAM|nr:NADH dehydrogenase [ubiquinone] 1 alpha subcomplex assembly factor 3-like isoform X1 [Homarus americanus]KAG7169129.1 NADH dehydrogenase [ubiquinone] 1 alpha subcomplex assembly factor 3-like [Homarus americanus]
MMLRRAIINSSQILKPRLGVLTRQPRCLQSSDDDDRTTVKVLNMEIEAGLMVDSYSQVGFRLNNGMSVIGPIALFPKTVLSWRVRSSQDINEDSLSLFYLLEPRLDILVIGVGDQGCRVDTRIIRFMKNKGVSLEILPTVSACTTFNFLNQERRYVAAALIPPVAISVNEDDLVQAERRRKKLYQSTEDDEVF